MSKEFFIGWSGELPNSNKKAIKKLMVPVVLGFAGIVVAFLLFTKPFNDHKFELGTVTDFEGTLYTSPFPALLLDEGQSPIEGKNHALLVGYGKNGALTFLPEAENIHGKRVKMRGTLIYGDGKVLIELTEKDESLVEIKQVSKVSVGKSKQEEMELQGEILDPKCWFGVMKPGEGKVHKSCAIRCVSGGIEPVLRVEQEGMNHYYVLKGVNGEQINQEVLQFIAEPVRVKAIVEKTHGWNVAFIDPTEIKYVK